MTRRRPAANGPQPNTDENMIQKSPRPVPVPSLADLAADVKSSLGSMAAVLDRHGVERRGRLVKCPAKEHEDRNPSASIFMGANGERLYCHGCGFSGDVIDVAEILGERVEWPKTGKPLPKRRKSRPRPMPREIADAFLDSPGALLSWEIAVELAKLPEAIARRHILAGWGVLAGACDIPLVVQWSRLIRCTTIRELSTSRSVQSPSAFAHDVRRLLGRTR